ncbi:MAG: hypothetical protein IIB56_13695 [Planctomycetes bacterium]|nr:hypothetical protein [Planctomycetota bacterium]
MSNGKTRIVYLKAKSDLDCRQASNLDVGPFRIDENGKVRLMCHDVLRVPSYIKVGHKNGNPFDNRKCNLYIIDPERQDND